MTIGHDKQLNQNRANEIFENHSPTFDVPLAFILFCIIYIVQEALVSGKSKPSRKYCFEIAEQIAALKFPNFVLNAELRVM